MFSPSVYKVVSGVFKKYFPDYLFFDKNLNKYIFSISHDLIIDVIKPNEALKNLLNKKELDPLENKAVNLILLLSEYSGVSLNYFGIHGSISLGMHGDKSDMDVSVYGAKNYRIVLETLRDLDKRGKLTLSRESLADRIKGNVGWYQGTRFVLNAIRLDEEIKCKEENLELLGDAIIKCRVIDDYESIFRPAIYGVSDCRVISGSSFAANVSYVVSMIGIYRGFARKGDNLIVKGMIENVNEGEYYRIVVGSGFSEEFISISPI
ncbi:hypothetical protein DRO38_07185 [Candidatus Bathyarchaeota archaeon]|nr:MAG: hypothetical protein DRO38_07185 [Candidatus Bathyarchaeota archaeon]